MDLREQVEGEDDMKYFIAYMRINTMNNTQLVENKVVEFAGLMTEDRLREFERAQQAHHFGQPRDRIVVVFYQQIAS